MTSVLIGVNAATKRWLRWNNFFEVTHLKLAIYTSKYIFTTDELKKWNKKKNPYYWLLTSLQKL